MVARLCLKIVHNFGGLRISTADQDPLVDDTFACACWMMRFTIALWLVSVTYAQDTNSTTCPIGTFAAVGSVDGCVDCVPGTYDDDGE
eukprot:COSAG02_NODE_4154_length_5707_cov_2.827389_4_plen_88_part_00